ADIASRAVHLFQPRPAFRSVKEAVIDYYLKQPAEEISIEILDDKGQVIRSFTGTAADEQKQEEDKKRTEPEEASPGRPTGPRPLLRKAGTNRFAWDLRYPGASIFDGMILWGARAEQGPLAVPGAYQVRLRANGQTQTLPLAIKKDPRLPHVTE